ncbi:hypothetical protein LTR91_013625 [Friedmanniomyces endolithicus]|uniref:Membrane anchor Opy2 N-terminal domain-containing protein n=1 Tax=Friedmanniomyces endolithicus TaxID=329885 RepID=A0AAN6FCH2_9PEZI|nr:hypothetical protein LTR35_010699 [Friedmanniomyces endolithicus]KAK0292375.1 hypothetical protein LTS00_007852 [Friedmanniomyces endolithicus]KAK0309179.1 hypothetical protein LTR82_015231 [Friedmanniomyces endolithicus]KAK0976591.1 hypothetical protein LTR91_013625 [Friedmanniomyces endolithicus]KAK0998322.1 hypothetical protein LTR54_009460 [Friedmanniomyces endolithicus]
MASTLWLLAATFWPVRVVYGSALLSMDNSLFHQYTRGEQASPNLRRDCPVPCGFSQQLCCNANEVCYTDPSYEAQCSATASPSSPTTVQVTLTKEATVTETKSQQGSLILSVSTFETTQQTTLVSILEATTSITQSPTTATLTAMATQTVATTKTAISTQTVPTTKTAVSTYLQPSSAAPPPTVSEAAARNGTALTQTAQKRPDLPRWEKIVVGVFAGIGGLLTLALISWLAYACFQCTRRRREDQRNQKDFNEMDVGGAGTFRQVNTATMQEDTDPNSQSLHRGASAGHYNPPRPRRVQLNDGVPNEYTIAEDFVDEAWPPSQDASEVSQQRGVSPLYAHAGRSDHQGRSRSAPLSPLERPYNRVPVPRTPARRSHPGLKYQAVPRPPTVEEYVEM